MKPGRELLLADLKPGALVLLEAVPPPEPLYLPGFIAEVVARQIRVKMSLGIGESYVRLHANKEGRFVTTEDRSVRVFESKASK